MKAKLSLFVIAAICGSGPAWTKASAAEPDAEPVPIGSPADWIDSGAYPATALRYDMTGVTAFTLAVDPQGKPTRCTIAESSGFDVLDNATCERLLANARFAPFRSNTGNPGERAYKGRIRWVMPEEAAATAPVSEHFGRVLLTLDAVGKVSSCRMVPEVPARPEPGSDPWCKPLAETLPPPVAQAMLERARGAPVEAEMQSAVVFTPELRARVLASRPNYEQLALGVYQFTVTKEGTLGKCGIVEQRGPESMIGNCRNMLSGKFDPPFSALDKDGVARGWWIIRTLVKTGR